LHINLPAYTLFIACIGAQNEITKLKRIVIKLQRALHKMENSSAPSSLVLEINDQNRDKSKK